MQTSSVSAPPRLDVLISGAGIAGATLASLLARQGHRITVVECDQRVRSSGNPVDVRGHAYDVVERMGLLPRLHQAATRVEEVVLVDHDGRPIARTPSRRRDQRDIEIPRADLSAILLEACPPDVEIIFDDEITRLEPRVDKVSATFRRTTSRPFDLVVGADGLHSRVRSLLWGSEARFSHPFGMYVASTQARPLSPRPSEPNQATFQAHCTPTKCGIAGSWARVNEAPAWVAPGCAQHSTRNHDPQHRSKTYDAPYMISVNAPCTW